MAPINCFVEYSVVSASDPCTKSPFSYFTPFPSSQPFGRIITLLLSLAPHIRQRPFQRGNDGIVESPLQNLND